MIETTWHSAPDKGYITKLIKIAKEANDNKTAIIKDIANKIEDFNLKCHIIDKLTSEVENIRGNDFSLTEFVKSYIHSNPANTNILGCYFFNGLENEITNEKEAFKIIADEGKLD